MANAKSEDGSFEVDYPEGVPYSSWNFNVYTMLTMIKKTCFGQVKQDLSYLIQQLLPGTTKRLLEKSPCLELERCFLANQKFDAERVGSMPEDVPIIQPIMQPIDAKGVEIMNDVGVAFECDYNLCFKDLSASENMSQKPELAESTMTPVQLQVVPSAFPGHVELEVHRNVDSTSGLQNLCVENRGRRLFSSELLIEQMYNVLTIITTILNVHRIKYHHNTNNIFREEDNISLLNYLQYVGQAGPAVHVVTCISGLSQNCRHLYLTEDVSLSVPCNEWPSCAKDWVHRARPSGWPTQELIDKVLQGGCHVVPKFETLENIPDASDKNETPNVAAKKVHQDGCPSSSSSNSGITSDARKTDESHTFSKFEATEKIPEASNKNETPNVAAKKVHQDGCPSSSSSNSGITSDASKTDESHTFSKFEATEKIPEASDKNETPNGVDKKVHQDGCPPSSSSLSGITSDASKTDESHAFSKFEATEKIPEASDKNETPNGVDKKVHQDGCPPSSSSNSGITSDASKTDESHAFSKFEATEKIPEASDKNETPNGVDKKVHQDGCPPSSSSNSGITSDARKTDESNTFSKFEASEKSQEDCDNNQLPDAENTVIKDGSYLEHTFEPSKQSSGEASSTISVTGTIDTLSHDSPPKTLWRYSFSFAEKILMTSITEVQKMCYLIFKYLFSKYIKLHSVITTYTAKTIFLWKLETVSSDQWTLQLIGDRVKDLVVDLRTCVKQKYCQHFFINECNILHQMDDKSRDTVLEVGFSLLDEHMADAPVLNSQIFEAPSGFPVDFMFTYKSFYSINAWLESLNAQMLAKLDAPSKLPSEQNVASLLDCEKTHPILMSESLKYLVLCEDIYGQCLPVPHSLMQHEKVKGLISFLGKSFTTPEKYEECLRELDVELKFLHLQFHIIDEIEQFFKDNPNFAYQFESSSDESDAQEDEPTE